MRRDMDKVIVERPRHDSKYDRPKGRRANLPHELLNPKEGMKVHKGGTKSLNENLAPLRRFIEAQVGRPWNKVYSELSQYIKPGNTVQEHVLTHLDDFISRHVVRVPPSAKSVCGINSKPGSRRFRGRSYPLDPGQLFVDDDGIIKKARQRFFVPGPRVYKNKLVMDGKDRICARENGCWFSAQVGQYKIETYKVLDPIDPKNPRAYRFERTKKRLIVDGVSQIGLSDAFLGWVSPEETLKLEKKFGAKNVFAIHGTRRQLSSKDLKRLGLKNEVED